jgi:hypothetical protein
MASQLVHDAVHAGKPHAAAFADFLGREERLEYSVDDVWWDARPVVFDAKLDVRTARIVTARGADVFPIARSNAHANRPDAAYCIARIEAEVEQNLVQMNGIEHHGRHVRIDLCLDLYGRRKR